MTLYIMTTPTKALTNSDVNEIALNTISNQEGFKQNRLNWYKYRFSYR